jgi:hypothetical protein
MALDDLDQALFEAKWGTAEEDVMEVIARILELPREAVERVIFAMEVVHGDISKQLYNSYSTLDDKLKQGLRSLVQEGLARVLVRDAINNDKPMLAPPQKLIKDPLEICSGCEWSFGCIANNYCTPLKCYAAGPPVGIRAASEQKPFELRRLRGGAALVTPVKLVGNTVTVTCAHPKGTFKIEAKDLTT